MQFQEMIDNDENIRRQTLQSRSLIDKGQKDKVLTSSNEVYDQESEEDSFEYDLDEDSVQFHSDNGSRNLKRIKIQQDPYDLTKQEPKTQVQANDTVQNEHEFKDDVKLKLAKNTSSYFVRILINYIDDNQNNKKFQFEEETLKVLNEYKGKIKTKTLNNNDLISLLRNPVIGPIGKEFFRNEAFKYILKSDKLLKVGEVLNSLKTAYLLCSDGELNE